ncbi:enoyl-CoA hydratase/isomerase family protein [Virgibacillus soli]|uniref:enoyl-CoA hydratase/isomerase family protein n=1 Tax=Paracerasibacillus soli TaxID=480284 RepID=UPI0035E70219
MDHFITYEHKQDYGIIRLNRPEKRNAISTEMMQLLKKYLLKAREEKYKFIVITGNGDKVFCAGGDLTELHGDLTPDDAFAKLYPMKEVLYEIVSFPVPVICFMNGDAMGGGCELATACDIRITKPGTRFGFIQSNLGIVPGWGGGVLLYEKVHPAFAFQWMMEGTIYGATYLLEKGWIHEVISEESTFERILATYSSRSLQQMKILKSQYKRKLSNLSLSADMNEEMKNAAILWDTHEHKQAVNRFLSRKR